MAGNERVLVVEDDRNTQDLIAALLEGAGYRVERASDGATGLKKAKALLPDLVLLDLMMPGMDGLAVCEELRFDPKTRDVPVIFLTGYGDADTDALASVLDAYAFIRKPFDPESLLREVRNCLNIFGRAKS